MGLPPDILSARVRNELDMCLRNCGHSIEATVGEKVFPIEIDVRLVKTPGPVLRDGKVSNAYEHRMKIIVTEEYPYEKPIVRWQTPIFHPNIMLERDGGYVCTRLLDDWTFGSNLLSFIKGIESLLVHPNPENPYASESCLLAAQYFREHRYSPPQVLKEEEPVAETPTFEDATR